MYKLMLSRSEINESVRVRSGQRTTCENPKLAKGNHPPCYLNQVALIARSIFNTESQFGLVIKALNPASDIMGSQLGDSCVEKKNILSRKPPGLVCAARLDNAPVQK